MDCFVLGCIVIKQTTREMQVLILTYKSVNLKKKHFLFSYKHDKCCNMLEMY